MIRKWLALLGVVFLTLSCATPTIPASPTSERSQATNTAHMPTPTTETDIDSPPEAAVQARSQLGQALGIPTSWIEIIALEEKVWDDACLGLEEPDEVCAQMQVDGWRITYEVQRAFEVRTDSDGQRVRWQLADAIPDQTAEGLPPEAIIIGQQALARTLDVSTHEIGISTMSRETWPNGCLGLAQADEMCTEALVEGWRAVMTVSQTMIAHTDQAGTMIRWRNDLRQGEWTAKSLPPEAARAAEQRLAAALDILPAQVNTVDAERVTWQDGCLGLGKPNESCIQAITPGWRVTLEANVTYEIHTDKSGQQIRWTQSGPDTTTSAVLSERNDATLQGKRKLAADLGIAEQDVQLLSSEAVSWRNGCLELADPDELCTQAIVPGYRITALVSKRYTARTDRAGDTVRWETPIPEPASVSEINIYLVAIEDGGQRGPQIGCGDSIVAVPRQIPPTQAPLRVAMEQLLSFDKRPDKELDLYNALASSDLQVDEAEIDDQGVAKVALSGEYQLGGACDTPRFVAQLEQTALQFDQVQDAEITLNGVPLEQALSARG